MKAFIRIITILLVAASAHAEVPNDIAIRLRDDVYLQVAQIEKDLFPRSREDMFKEMRELLIFGNDDLVRARDRAYMNAVLDILRKYSSAYNVEFSREAPLIRAISKNLEMIHAHSLEVGESFPRNLSGRFKYLAGIHTPPYLELFLKEASDRIQTLRLDADLSTVRAWVQSFSDFLEENKISCNALLRG